MRHPTTPEEYWESLDHRREMNEPVPNTPPLQNSNSLKPMAQMKRYLLSVIHRLLRPTVRAGCRRVGHHRRPRQAHLQPGSGPPHHHGRTRPARNRLLQHARHRLPTGGTSERGGAVSPPTPKPASCPPRATSANSPWPHEPARQRLRNHPLPPRQTATPRLQGAKYARTIAAECQSATRGARTRRRPGV